MLARLIERLIDRLDELDPDPDAEDDDPAEDDGSDRCAAGDDGVFSGPTSLFRANDTSGTGDDVDAEGDDNAPPGSTKSSEAHRRRIRATRCEAIGPELTGGGSPESRLCRDCPNCDNSASADDHEPRPHPAGFAAADRFAALF
jgi:hypothetical protein